MSVRGRGSWGTEDGGVPGAGKMAAGWLRMGVGVGGSGPWARALPFGSRAGCMVVRDAGRRTWNVSWMYWRTIGAGGATNQAAPKRDTEYLPVPWALRGGWLSTGGDETRRHGGETRHEVSSFPKLSVRLLIGSKSANGNLYGRWRMDGVKGRAWFLVRGGRGESSSVPKTFAKAKI